MSTHIADKLIVEMGELVHEFEHANYFREDGDLVVYTTKPIRVFARFKDSEVTCVIMKWSRKDA